ncbi:MAG: prepilin-type N-terminal cleavage/methylation domain-containing protein [Uliginosibacterium sp.]|nr:prepilin-type N-terminal cleavage/methylation domain-containing protein [Uliginosibacterium sp.]
MKTNAGFTLVELMITIAVLAILSAIVVPSMRDMVLRNEIATTTNLASVICHLCPLGGSVTWPARHGVQFFQPERRGAHLQHG